MGTAWIEVGLI
jgi:hypothetical protein